MRNYSKLERVCLGRFTVLVFKYNHMITTYQPNIDELEIINSSFVKLSENAKKTATFFYCRLIEMDDTFEPLLNRNMNEFKEAFIDTIQELISYLDSTVDSSAKREELTLKIKALNLSKDKFDTIGAVFIDSIANCIGNDFTPPIMKSWVKAYKFLVSKLSTESYN